MSAFHYAIKSLFHFWRLNLTIILGVALSTAILLGALIIGDTVSFSLKQITLQRLGKTDWVISGGERLFRKELAAELSDNNIQTCPLLFSTGMAVLDGGKTRVNQLQVWGVPSGFNDFAETDKLYGLNENEAVINEQLALSLGVKEGEELLLRVNKLNTFPANTPFVSADENMISFRVKVKAIAAGRQTGNFNLQNIQSAPKNIFISLEWLNHQMQLDGKANIVLVHAAGLERNQLLNNLSMHWQLTDLNLKVRENTRMNYTELVSERIFVEPAVSEKLLNTVSGSYPVFSYFVNRFQYKERRTPYSFVTGLSEEKATIAADEIVLNHWLADDLNAVIGDSLQLSYFEVGPLRRLNERSAWFRIARVVEMSGPWTDRELMPDIPGLSDAGHCSDWEAGVPVNLSDIRPKDEAYWNDFKGTPKAFVNIKTARKLWGNRFGTSTAIRLDGLHSDNLEQQILTTLTPVDVGFQLKDVRSEGLQAAGQGVDFGRLFIGLSFFVLFAALLLAYLMFLLYLNFRRMEIGTLHAIGFSTGKIGLFFFAEAVFLVLSGILAGLPLGLAYDYLILDAINTIWHDIVRTSVLHIHITTATVIRAVLIIALISLTSVWLILRQYARQQIIQVQRMQEQKAQTGKWSLRIGIVLVLLSVVLFIMQGFGKEINPEIFFISGFGLLPGLILLLNYWFVRQLKKAGKNPSFRHFSFLLLLAGRRQHMLVVSFLSVGVFLVLSTGMNRKDLARHADESSSGTGGYTFFAETSFPVLFDLNTIEGRFELGLEDSSSIGFVQFHALRGDDASCLNLNRVQRPRILGFDPAEFNERHAFTFATRSGELDDKHPWLTLNKSLPNGQIPAVIDQTVLTWGLGKSVGDTLVYRNEAGEPMTLKLVGGLSNSVFQGNILIADSLFYANFPSVSGSQIFLIQAPENEEENIRSAFRNYGLEITRAGERLLLFYQVENTYLNIFLMLGTLGLLIGTVGLGIVIFRGIFEKKSQYALMEAVGFRKQKIRRMILRGNMLIVSLSLIIGLIPSFLSALPVLLSSLYVGLIYWSLGIFILILASAWFWVFIANRLAMKGNLYEALRND